MLCQVYRSPRKEQMYLYVSKAEGLARVPEALLGRFGEPEPIMLLNLDGTRKLARADADQVVAQIEEKGFYLQMPPTEEELRRGA
ncbi:MAG: YcgL domain-containing protein [Halieaceae bacterium]|nr:YcgL domain-containing protein [Halieaceae bacterium]